MTVAPTGIAVPQFDAIPRPRITCAVCATTADPREPFCAHCGARVVVPGRKGSASVAATRSLQLAVVLVLTNIVVGGTSFGVVYLLSDAERLTEAALGLEVMRWLVIGTLVAFAIRSGIRGLRETGEGGLRRRSWAVIGIAVSALFGLLVTLSCVATALLFLAQR